MMMTKVMMTMMMNSMMITIINFAGPAPPQTHNSVPQTHHHGPQHLQHPPHRCPWPCHPWSGRTAPWTRPARPSTSSCSQWSRRCPRTSDPATPAPSPVPRGSRGELSMLGFWLEIIWNHGLFWKPAMTWYVKCMHSRWESAWLRQNEAQGHELMPAWTRLNPHFDNLTGCLLQFQISLVILALKAAKRFLFPFVKRHYNRLCVHWELLWQPFTVMFNKVYFCIQWMFLFTATQYTYRNGSLKSCRTTYKILNT